MNHYGKWFKCERKVKYYSEIAAKNGIDKLIRDRSKKKGFRNTRLDGLTTYICPICDCYHIGHEMKRKDSL